MEINDIIKMLIEYPKDKETTELLIAMSTEEGIIKTHISTLAKIGQSIKKITEEKAKIDEKLENSPSPEYITEKERKSREITCSDSVLLEQKIQEKKNTKELIRSKCNFIAGNISEKEYNTIRDELVTNIILCRATTYKTKEWIKAWSASCGIMLDIEWYSSVEIYMIGNKRDKTSDKVNKAQEARIVESQLRKCVEKKESILPSNNNQKEAIALLLIAPEYISKRMIEIKEFNSKGK